MSATLRSYRIVAITVIVFAVLFFLLWESGQRRDLTRDHSAFRRNAWGCAALAELCRTTQPSLTVRELTAPLDDLSKVRGLLVILDPTEPFADEEVDRLVRWVQGGGTLLVGIEGLWDDLTGAQTDTGPPYVKLAAAFGVAARRQQAEPLTTATPVPTSPLGRGVAKVATSTHYVLAPLDGQDSASKWAEEEFSRERVRCLVPHPAGSLTYHLVADGRPIVASFAYGRGQVYVTSDVQMLANSLLPRDDNVAFAANLIWRNAASRTVYFDEYHHRFGERRLMASQVDPAPLNRSLLVVLAGVVLLLIGKAIRFGAPVAVFGPRRRAASEYVEALADLWRGAEAYPWAVAQIAAAFRHRAAAEVGLRASASADVLAATLAARRGVPEDEALSLFRDLERAQDNRTLGRKEATSLVSRMAMLEGRLRHPRPKAGRPVPKHPSHREAPSP